MSAPLSPEEVFGLRPQLIRFLAVRSVRLSLAEEVVDAVILKAVERGGMPKRSYTYAAVLNQLRDHLKSPRAGAVGLCWTDAEGVEHERRIPDARAALAHEAVEGRLAARAQLDALLADARLSDAQVAVLQARHQSGGDLSFAQVGVALGMTATEARSHHANALRQIRKAAPVR